MNDSRLTWDHVERAMSDRPARRLERPCSRRAAVALVLRDGGMGLEVLFVRRSEHPRDPWSGHMAFPGGRAEPGDADGIATAERETLEETGLDLARNANLLGALDELQAMRRGGPVDLSIEPFVFRLCVPTELSLSEEVVSVHWVPLSRLLSREHRGTVPIADGGPPLDRPCIQVEGQVIWGLTYRMFESFAGRIQAAS
jgi:8-oxo-dGTP pyrophosphatase MutT (NUDIX family)